MEIASLSSADLAYLGDAVLELLTRETLLERGVTDVGKLNRLASGFVTAVSQAEGYERIRDELTGPEEDVFRRARNHSKTNVPRSATPEQYRKATGMEALFAYLYLTGDRERMTALFSRAFPYETVK